MMVRVVQCFERRVRGDQLSSSHLIGRLAKGSVASKTLMSRCMIFSLREAVTPTVCAWSVAEGRTRQIMIFLDAR